MNSGEEMTNVFEQVLSDDEKILKVLKPNKTKFLVGNMLVFSLLWLILGLWIGLVASSTIGTTIIGPDGEIDGLNPISFVVAFVLSIFIFEILTFVFSTIFYKKTFYAISNKRLIVRKGIFGVKFKSLDLDTLGAVDAKVSPLDKILHKNTGSIFFGSMANPLGISVFKFENIENPYDICKQIKELADKNKKP